MTAKTIFHISLVMFILSVVAIFVPMVVPISYSWSWAFPVAGVSLALVSLQVLICARAVVRKLEKDS